MLVEILSEQENYKLRKFSKLYSGLARQIQIDADQLRSIIEAMLHEYELLSEDENYIWSESLLRRMEVKATKRQAKVEAGRKGGISSGVSRKKEADLKQNEALLQANEPKESKAKKSKENDKEKPCLGVFESLWSLYPKKRGKGQVSDTQKQRLYKIGVDKLAVCIERYLRETAGKEEQYIQNGSTFFNSGYVDYLDENYQPGKIGPKINRNAQAALQWGERSEGGENID